MSVPMPRHAASLAVRTGRGQWHTASNESYDLLECQHGADLNQLSSALAVRRPAQHVDRRALNLLLVAYAMGDMTGGDDFAGQFAMTGLIVEKHVGGEGLEEGRLGQAAEKQRRSRRMSHSRKVRITRSWAGADRAVTRAADRTGIVLELRCNRLRAARKP